MTGTQTRLPRGSSLTIDEKIAQRGEKHGECIIWKGPCNQLGAPVVMHDGKYMRVQRYLLEKELERELLEGCRADQTCKNELCVAAEHQYEKNYRRGANGAHPAQAAVSTTRSAPASASQKKAVPAQVSAPLNEVERTPLSVEQKIKLSYDEDKDGCHIWRMRLENGKPYLLHDGRFISVRNFVAQQRKPHAEGYRILGVRCNKEACIRAECLITDPPFVLAVPAASPEPLAIDPKMNLALYLHLHMNSAIRRYFARRTKRGKAQIDDLFSELTVRFMRRTCEGINDVPSYIYRCAGNLLHETSVKESVEHKALAEGLSGLYGECGIIRGGSDAHAMRVDLDFMDQQQLARQIADKLVFVSRKAAGVFVMHVVYGMTYDEIAQLLGFGPTMAKKYLNIVFRTVRERLNLEPVTRRSLFTPVTPRPHVPNIATTALSHAARRKAA